MVLFLSRTFLDAKEAATCGTSGPTRVDVDDVPAVVQSDGTDRRSTPEKGQRSGGPNISELRCLVLSSTRAAELRFC